MIANLHKLFSVISVSETWLNEQTSKLVDIPGYHFISNPRKHKTGVGTALYLQDNYEI